MFIIMDDFSNILQYTGKFNFSAYGANTGAPMTFKSFDDAVEYLDINELELNNFTIEEL